MQPSRSGHSQVLETMKPTLKYADNLRRNRFQTALVHYSKKATWVLGIALLSAVQLAAQKVKIDYDKTTDFSKFKTYAWVQGTPVMDPRLDTYIKKSLNDMFQHIGMTEASVSTADIVITYHAAVNTDLSVGTALDPTFAASGGVAIPGQSIWETAGGAAAAHVTKGGLAFEILDRAANRPIWTGIAQRTVSDKPSERWDQVQKALDKLFRTFPPTPQKTTSARQ
jgi:hypothetical protein